MKNSATPQLVTIALVLCTGCSDLLGINDFSEGDQAGADSDTEDRDQVGGNGGGGGIGGGDGGGGNNPGSQTWARAFGAASSQDVGQSIAVHGSDDITVVGTIAGIVDFGGGTLGSGQDQVFVTRLSRDGDHQRSAASASNASVALGGAATDASGNVVIVGSFSNGTWKALENGTSHPSQGSDSDVFVAKLEPEGATTWKETWSLSFVGAGDQFLRGVATGQDGSVVVVGSLRGTLGIGMAPPTSAGGDDILVARFDSSGTLDWVRSYGDSSSQVATAVAIDNDGLIWVAGTFDGSIDFGTGTALSSVGNSDVFVARLSVAGDVLASARFGNGGAHTVGGAAIVDGGVVMVGSFTGNTDFGGEQLQANQGNQGNAAVAEDIFVVNLDDNLAHRWSRGFGGTGPDVGLSVVIDADENVIVGGKFSSVIADLDMGLESAGGTDALVLKLDSAGTPEWSATFGRNDDDWVGGVAVDSEQAVVATGQFVGAFTLSDEIVQGKGKEDIFVIKLRP